MNLKFLNGIAKLDKKFLILPECTCNFFPHLGVIFIHIPKTGGTALSLSLAWEDFRLQVSGQEKRWDIPRKNFRRHEKISSLVKNVPQEVWKNSVKFAVVRNPWETMLSSYMWFTQTAPATVTNPKARAIVKSVQNVEFDEFLLTGIGRSHINWEVGEMWQYFQVEKGIDEVDFVARLEDKDALERLGGLLNIQFQRPVGKYNATSHKHYRYYYSKSSRDLVHERFKYEIERFNYEF